MRPSGSATADARGGPSVIGIDGGGTRTTIALAESGGRELLRRVGPPGRIEPQDPAGSAERLVRLIRDVATEAGATLPVDTLCAGLAGAGTVAARETMHSALAAAHVARRIAVVTDGEIALDGALGGGPGILLIAGTGSVAYGRSEQGGIARCGGWGEIAGDEGSGYAIAIGGLRAALHAADGRGAATQLLPELLSALDIGEPAEVAPWVGRAEKGAVAALAPRVLALAEGGDAVAREIVAAAAGDLARHVVALVERLGPWSPPVPVVFHGGALSEAALARRVEERLRSSPIATTRRDPAADAVAGAVQHARRLP